MDREKLSAILREKYRYLFISLFQGKYDLIDIEIIDIETENDELVGMVVDFKIDSLNAIHGDEHTISGMLRDTNADIMDFLYKFPVNPKTRKIDRSFDNVRVIDGLFLKVDYIFDEKHYMEISYRIDYE